MPIKTECNILNRYLLRAGLYGNYFYDKHDAIDLPLILVIKKLNDLNNENLKLIRENDKYKTYLIDNDLMKYLSNKNY